MLELLQKLPIYQMARGFNLPPPMPINLTLSLLYRCNARCKTCRSYERDPVEEMTPAEWRRVFDGLGTVPYWVTFSGGEPFLYRDLVEVYYDLTETCRPAIVNIPTNGLMTDRIVGWIWEMVHISPETKLIVNVSLDHCVATLNDEIRGVRGYYEKAVETVKELQAIKADNLTVGLHTVISKHNVGDFWLISDMLPRLLKDKSHYITEIAEERVELGTMGMPITPEYNEYRVAIRSLLDSMNGRSVISAFRREYYGRVLRWLQGKRTSPCYAGYASCQIAPDSMVWFCCVRAEPVGNLRDSGYDFKAVWHSGKAEQERKRIKETRCSCPMANASYTNMLLHYPALVRVVRNLL